MKVNFLDRVEGISKVTVWMAGFALIFVAIIVSVEVFLRQVFNFGSSFGTEYSSFMLTACVAFGLSFTLLKRGHVRVDLIKSFFPKTGVFLDLLSVTALLIFSAFLSVYGWGVLSDSVNSHSVSTSSLETPLWIPQGIWAVGLFFFTFTCAAILINSISKLVRGDMAGASSLISAPSIGEEVEDAVRDATKIN